jgi:hypothetical protein
MCKYLTIISNSKQLLTRQSFLKLKEKSINKSSSKTNYDSWNGSFVKRMILTGNKNRDDIFLL